VTDSSKLQDARGVVAGFGPGETRFEPDSYNDEVADGIVTSACKVKVARGGGVGLSLNDSGIVGYWLRGAAKRQYDRPGGRVRRVPL